MSDHKMATSEEQILYAAWLEKGMLAGLVLMLITFSCYVSGIMTPVIPLEQLSQYWGLSAKEYLAVVNSNFLHWQHAPTGWAWLKLLGRGDFLNFLPVAILAGITMLCYVVILPVFVRKGDKAYIVMCAAETIILALAASGILAAGH